jgi:hypothetical protein
MNQEIQRMRGLLAVNREKRERLQLEASGLVVLVRQYLDPYEQDFTRLKIDEALQSMTRLAEIRREAAELGRAIAQLEEDLGG